MWKERRKKVHKIQLMNTKREKWKRREKNRTIKETNDVIVVLLPILLMTLTSPSFGFCLPLDTIKLIYECVCVCCEAREVENWISSARTTDDDRSLVMLCTTIDKWTPTQFWSVLSRSLLVVFFLSFSFSLSIRRVTASVYSPHVSNMSDTLHLIFHSFILCSLVSIYLSLSALYLSGRGEKKRKSRSEEQQKRHVVDVVVLFCSVLFFPSTHDELIQNRFNQTDWPIVPFSVSSRIYSIGKAFTRETTFAR